MDTFIEYVIETLSRIEAEVTFEKQITIACPECGAAPGSLCDANLVWVHLARFKAFWEGEFRGHQNR